jgi:predicted RNA-binding protein associated with RNAse of E/G family
VEPIAVIKQNADGREVVRYHGHVLARGATWVKLEATYEFGDKPVGEIFFRRGDRFVEWHYADRWYNIFEVHAGDDDHLRGWYCNVTRPARIDGGEVRADDLALDVLILPDGRVTILDEDEFAALTLTPAEQQAVRAAVDDLRRAAQAGEPPFEALASRRRG